MKYHRLLFTVFLSLFLLNLPSTDGKAQSASTEDKGNTNYKE